MIPQKFKAGFLSFLGVFPILATVIFAAYVLVMKDWKEFDEKIILKWLLVVVGLLATSELVERFQILSKIERTTEETCDKAGETHNQITNLQDLLYQGYQIVPGVVGPIVISHVNGEKVTRHLIENYTDRLSKKKDVGSKQYPVQYYINFKRCDIEGELTELALVIANMIKNEKCSFTKIAVPDTGIRFGAKVASLFQKPYLQVAGSHIPHYDFIGQPPSTRDEIIIISDVTLTGYSSLELPIEKIRNCGGKVKHAFVLVERTDLYLGGTKGPRDSLKDLGVNLHSCLQFSDDELKSIFESRNASRQL